MSPPAVSEAPSTVESTIAGIQALKVAAVKSPGFEQTTPATTTTTYPAPLKLTGALDKYPSFDNTPVIGREFDPSVKLQDLLDAPNSDELIRELAITISQRNVVFFRDQGILSTETLKKVIQRLGELAGKPAESTLHIHPVINAGREGAGDDNEISKISSVVTQKLYKFAAPKTTNKRQRASPLWHSDITFEPVPADYSVLQIVEKPATGGDTLWASGYEVYDRISAPYQKFLEGLTATYAQPGFISAAKTGGFEIYSKARGHPLNVGETLTAVHPVVRTNPVTGWKSIFAFGHHVSHINDLTDRESKHLLEEFIALVTENHDLQVRFRWGQGDIAIWDNRSTYHTGTSDLSEGDVRIGNRAVGIAEIPYLDAEGSVSRREALGQTIPLQGYF
ncbi:putative alpha-ketoglutarate-dependent taurine dioxygenase [Peziza echinospora]|nr:putative alpha-ketoglutarate-dependent taurine dioxygenase [Peziza echinospora]